MNTRARTGRLAAIAVIACSFACGESSDTDAGLPRMDAAAGTDASSDAMARADSGPLDAGTRDASPLDGASPSPDASTSDASTLDAGSPDAGAEDAGAEDAGAEDAGAEDAGAEDAGAGDAGAGDAGAEDADAEDAGPETCNAPGVTLQRCSGDVVESCTGIGGLWMFESDCSDAGQVCHEPGLGVALCRDP